MKADAEAYCSWCHDFLGLRPGFNAYGETNTACIPCAEAVLVEGEEPETAAVLLQAFRRAIRNPDEEFLAAMWQAAADDSDWVETSDRWGIRANLERYQTAYNRSTLR